MEVHRYSSSEENDGEESSELDDSSDDSDVEVSSLFLEEEKGQKQSKLCLMENEDTSGPYEQIEGLMQPKVQPNVKDELIQKMLSPDLTSHEKGVYLHMLQQFPNLFITSYEEIRGFKGEEINIPIKEGAQPMRQKLRRMGQVQLNALKEEVDKLLKAGFIYPVSIADWVIPVVVTPKKDGKWRVCANYKPLNAAMKRDPYSLPFIDDILDSVAGHERYSVCDGFSGYFQLNLAQEDQKKTTFITPWGCFCYHVLPFGLMSGCAWYQGLPLQS
ncbi:hypothetical protein L7F22_063817 [Adiantum nelumboides]|nr:hypothetical protein [Adiantum nelumboides]